jgi:hypothetical protein
MSVPNNTNNLDLRKTFDTFHLIKKRRNAIGPSHSWVPYP